MYLKGMSTTCFQSQMSWGLVSQVLVLKVAVGNVGYKPFSPRGEALGFEFPPDLGLPHWVWGLGDCVLTFSTHFDMVSLLFAQCEGATLPVFRVFSEKSVPYIPVDSMCL